ncbi:MAG: hypothetical protein FWF04_04050, partial [Clostridiales bacterium]|nr:hypothetical protein [Clostridiales bacterium]
FTKKNKILQKAKINSKNSVGLPVVYSQRDNTYTNVRFAAIWHFKGYSLNRMPAYNILHTGGYGDARYDFFGC